MLFDSDGINRDVTSLVDGIFVIWQIGRGGQRQNTCPVLDYSNGYDLRLPLLLLFGKLLTFHALKSRK